MKLFTITKDYATLSIWAETKGLAYVMAVKMGFLDYRLEHFTIEEVN